MSELLTAAEAGQRLGISARTVYAIAKAGRLACHRLGVGNGAIRFDPADLEEYKNQCRSPATTQAAGSSSLTASSPDLGVNALTAYFRQAGRKHKPKPTTNVRQDASTRLQLVSSSTST
ncbi:Helix-turn-helix domain protein [compost metagenome]